jgi:succinate dehydrogenase / fumarate reductase cytochrome b subunit
MADTQDRPLSPHLQVWRFHITMLVSILHRITGVGLYLGALMGAGWALSLASGPVAYDRYMRILGSPLGKFVLFGMTLSMFFHLGNGVRHLIWDTGEGFELRQADFGAWLVIGFAIVGTLVTWILAFMTGAL